MTGARPRRTLHCQGGRICEEWVMGEGTSFPEADDRGRLRNRPAPMEIPRASLPCTLANRRARGGDAVREAEFTERC
jgi:hypothetical protein